MQTNESAEMKRYSATTLATVALALGVWIFFYVLDPEMPLDSAEMFVVVAGCAAVVVVAKWAWNRETVGVKNHS